MLNEISPEQFDEWQAYHELEPFGGLDAWRQVGEICSTLHECLMLVAEAQGAKIKNKKSLAPADFMPLHPLDKKALNKLRRKKDDKKWDVRLHEAELKARYGGKQ